MDFSMGRAARSGDEQDAQASRREKKAYRRHTSYQITQLDEFFKDCPHPDETLRRQLGMELGLEPKQIKFWFQNKRTQIKTQNERTDNNILRVENEKLQSENLAMRETLKNVVCQSCGSPPIGEEERELLIQNLKLENAKLKEEYKMLSNFIARYNGSSMPQPGLLPPTLPPTYDPSSPECFLAISDDDMLANPMTTSRTIDMEKALMLEAATTAMEELVRLIRIDEPLWCRSSLDGKFILQHECYEMIFHRGGCLKGPNARVESSKDSRIVTICGTQLVEMLLDSDKLVDLFSTFITKAQTIQILESGMLGNRSGALLLMYQEMHILSPLVPSREFFFLRHCKQVEVGVWVIADVSFDSLEENVSHSHSWRLPSGCMIHELPNGYCKVTWIEHVVVDEKIQTHRLYRDLICINNAYGAKRWLFTLERMCERFALASFENIPSHDAGGVIQLAEGRRSVMKLAHRMVKSFWGILSMSSELDFPHSSQRNNGGVSISIRKITEPGEPNGMIVAAATSFWLPLPSQNIFEFLKDDKRRAQWDVLSCGNPTHEIAHIFTGTHTGNYISIIRPFVPSETNMLILQENYIDPLGSLVVYAPIDAITMNVVMRGEDDSLIVPILPSGFIVSEDGRFNVFARSSNRGRVGRAGGSLLTAAFQMLVSSPSTINELNIESVAAVNALVTSTVQKIKVALNCGDLE